MNSHEVPFKTVWRPVCHVFSQLNLLSPGCHHACFQGFQFRFPVIFILWLQPANWKNRQLVNIHPIGVHSCKRLDDSPETSAGTFFLNQCRNGVCVVCGVCVCVEVFPMQMEGVRLTVNKGLSNYFQVSQGLLLHLNANLSCLSFAVLLSQL